MSTLLSILWRHCSKGAKPREDFFSDIVAELFKEHPEFLCQWLRTLPMEPANVTDPTISVRQHFSSLHGPEGFFDIFIRLRDGEGEHHVVIESKIDTTAWDGQLKKYDAEMARRLSIIPREKLKATIIYITRDSEHPKATSGNAHFVQTRWECFLQTLEAFCKTNSSWFAAQVRDFMIEQRIATPVQVTPMHLDAFLNFRPCLEMFDAVLDSEIRDEFTKLGGTMMVNHSQRLDSLKSGWIYGLRCHHGSWKVGFHLGFWNGYPDPGVVYAGGLIGFYLKDLQKSPAEEQLLSSAAKLLAAHGTWKRHASNHFARNPGFIWARPLSEAISLENNATVLRAALRPVLDSMRDFQLKFQLPWEGEPTFAKDDVNETQDLIPTETQPSLVQDES